MVFDRCFLFCWFITDDVSRLNSPSSSPATHSLYRTTDCADHDAGTFLLFEFFETR